MDGYVFIEPKKLKATKQYPHGRTRYYVFACVDGKKTSRGAFNTDRDARKRKRLIESQIADATFGVPEKEDPTFGEYFESWWSSKKKSLRTSTRSGYESAYKLYILPFFSDMRLSEIQTSDIQRFVDSLDEVAPSHVRQIFTYLRCCLNSAVKWGIIDRSPWKAVILPKIPNVQKQFLEPSEMRRLLRVCDFPYKAIFAVLGYSGLRIGECLGLRGKSVEIASRSIQVDLAWNVTDRELSDPKTSNSVRSVDMLNTLADTLSEYFQWRGGVAPDSFLFPSRSNPQRPISYQTVARVLKEKLQQAGLKEVEPHSFRHFCASIFLAAGASINTVARNLGDTPETIWRVYGHEIKESLGPVLKKADLIIAGFDESDDLTPKLEETSQSDPFEE